MNILVVGGGKMGLSHLAILSRVAGQSEVSLCDSSILRRFIFRRLNYKVFKSLHAALDSGVKWTGAVIATPTNSHYLLAKSLLERGIPCFIEKPLTLDPRKSQELMELRQQNKLVTQVGLAARFIAAFVKLRWIVESKVLGSPLRYEAHMLGNVITKPDNNTWRTNFSQGGGCLNEYGPHLLDLCRYCFGDVDIIKSATARHVFSTKADDAVDVSWSHKSGCNAEIFLNWCDASKRKAELAFTVEFEGGTVKASNMDVEVILKEGCNPSPELTERLFAPLLPHAVTYYLRGEEFTLQMEVFIESLTGRKILIGDALPVGTAATLEDGLEVDKLIHEIAVKVGLI